MRLNRWTTIGSAAGIAAACLLWLGIARMVPVHVETADTAGRVGLACAALLPTASVLVLMIVSQMVLRAITGRIDPLAGADPALLRVNQRVLTNTVEQLAVFTPALLALAAGSTGNQMRTAVAAGFVFALARLIFWLGYLLGPLTRAPGMAATLAVNLATLVAAIWAWGPSYRDEMGAEPGANHHHNGIKRDFDLFGFLLRAASTSNLRRQRPAGKILVPDARCRAWHGHYDHWR